jgi:transcriptional antiterminator
MISKEYLDKFKKLYKDKYEITLSDEEATELATHFLNFMEILIRPKPKTNALVPKHTNSSVPERRQYATR